MTSALSAAAKYWPFFAEVVAFLACLMKRRYRLVVIPSNLLDRTPTARSALLIVLLDFAAFAIVTFPC
jgi:hypothetical protein